MFWLVMLIVMVLVIGVSVVVGLSLRRRGDARKLSQHDKVTMAKASGAFKHRKSNQ